MVDGLGRVRARPGRGRAHQGERRPRDGDARPVVFPSDVDILPRGAGHSVVDTRRGRIPGLVERVDDRRDQSAGLGARRPLEPGVGSHASCARASGAWRSAASGVAGTLFRLAFRDRREKRPSHFSRHPKPRSFAMDPLAPSITFYDKETGKGRTTYLGACLRGTSLVTRVARTPSRVVGASRGSSDALSPPAFAHRRQPHPGAALHPHPWTVVHEPRIRGETRHARVRRTFASAALPTRCPRSAPAVPRPRPSVSG